MTSQSTVTVYSPRAFMSHTVRRLRPMSRSISMERPLRAEVSRRERVVVEQGSIAYSALTQPAWASLRHLGTPSSMVAQQMSFVAPNSTWQEPDAWGITARVRVTGRMPPSGRP